MTRNDFSTALILASFALLAIRTDAVSLAAFIAAVALHAGLVLLPYVFDSGRDVIRKELSDALTKHAAEIKEIAARVDTLTLRGGR